MCVCVRVRLCSLPCPECDEVLLQAVVAQLAGLAGRFALVKIILHIDQKFCLGFVTNGSKICSCGNYGFQQVPCSCCNEK